MHIHRIALVIALTTALAGANCTGATSGASAASVGGDAGATVDVTVDATQQAQTAASQDTAAPNDDGDAPTALEVDASDAGASDGDTAGLSTPGSDAVAGDATGAGDSAADTVAACDPTSLSDLFQKKIKPLVSKGQPTTCNQCHLSGIDLGLFVQDTACNSMACMKAKGLVDFADPPKSQVLSMIAKAKPESKLITANVQQSEYDAFLQWIVWSATCQDATCGAPAADPCVSGALPPPPAKPMLGGCDETTLASSFAAKVFKWKYRCDHCHSPTGKDANKSFEGVKPTLFLHPASGALGAKYTMYNVLSLQDGVNVANPTQSKLLTKPLAEDAGGVWHGGGDKFQDTKDASYVDFLAWIKMFAACKAKP